jgi:hypothetical protein
MGLTIKLCVGMTVCCTLKNLNNLGQTVERVRCVVVWYTLPNYFCSLIIRFIRYLSLNRPGRFLRHMFGHLLSYLEHCIHNRNILIILIINFIIIHHNDISNGSITILNY